MCERESEIGKDNIEICGCSNLMWQALEEGKNFLSAPAFSLYYRCPKYGVCLLCKVEKKINFEGE